MSTKKLNIEKKKFILSKIKCLENKSFQAKIYASMLAIEVFSDFLEEKGIDILREKGLCNALLLSEELDIADIRTKNNVVIDVRTILGDEYSEICIPREHFSDSEEYRPDIYVGVRVDKSFEEAEFIGCVKADDVTRTKGSEKYFVIDAGELSPVEEIAESIKSVEPAQRQFIALDHKRASNLYLSFIDRIISNEDKKFLISHVAGCNECRESFINLCNLNSILKTLKSKLMIDEDYTLRLFNGDPVLASDKEIDVVIPEEEQEDVSEEVLEEILSEEKEDLVLRQKSIGRRNPMDWAGQLEEDTQTKTPEEILLSEEDFVSNEEISQVNDVPEVLTQKDVVLSEKTSSPDEVELIEEKPEAPLEEALIEEDISEKETLTQEEVVLSEDSFEFKGLEEGELDILASEEELEPLAFDNDLEQQDLLDEYKSISTAPDIALDATEKNLTDETEVLKEEPESALKEVEDKSVKPEAVEASGQKDAALENILETLDDVEVINEEDDIDSLLSFFDADGGEEPSVEVQEQKPISSEPPQEPLKETSPEPPKETPLEISEKNQEKESKAKEIGDYATVLGSTSSDSEELFDVTDILIYEEGKIDEITQEDLLNIFETDSARKEKEKEKQSEKPAFSIESIKPLLKDKKMIALAATIALSATVLIVYLGQPEKPNEVSNFNQNNNTIHVNNNPFTANTASLEERTRKPLTFYTRELVKTAKHEKKVDDMPEKVVEEKAVTPEKKEDKKQEVKEVRVKNISWELSASVIKEPKIKKYFLDTGYVLKEQLSKNLYVPELEVKDARINIYAELDKQGNILRSTVYQGSGSEEVDKRCLDSLIKIIKTNKFPKVMLNENKIKLKLLITI